MENKNIIRVKKRENPYLILDKTSLLEKELSWKAKGIHAYLLSLPDDWKIYDRDLVNRAKDGLDGLRAGMKELIQKGYVKRTAIRDEAGKIIRWETLVFEVPQNVKPDTENPDVEKPDVAKPDQENPTYTNYPLNYLSNELNATTTSEAENEAVSDYSKAQSAYMKAGWGLPNGFSSQVLQSDIEDYGLNVVLHAIETAAMRNAKSYSYTKTMFKEWDEKGLKTVEQIEQYEDSKAVARNKQYDRNNRRSQTTKNGGAPSEFKNEF